MIGERLFVVVPFLNEAESIDACLEALAVQSDPDISLILVDNGSTDHSRALIDAFRARHAALDVEVVDEPEKGTGSAADTGFRRACDRGARIIARTDADCLPRHDWVAQAKLALRSLEFAAGRIEPRDDDYELRWIDRLLIPSLVAAAEAFGRIRSANRGPQYRTGYIMAAGNNLAIHADTYVRCGGFPRTRIEDAHEDRALVNRVRTVTTRIGKAREMVVYNSIRRLRAYGYVRTLLWYWDHHYRPAYVDVRGTGRWRT